MGSGSGDLRNAKMARNTHNPNIIINFAHYLEWMKKGSDFGNN